MLLGREEERRALATVLDAARGGGSAALVLSGEPGIGKTALLDDAVAGADGMQVLRARGVEAEAHVPFSGLLELLRPVLALIDRVPEPQADALAGALALRPARAGDRFAIGAATLSLLAAASEDTPVLVAVDDAQWLDAASAEALLFAVRRLVADPVAVLLAVRSEEPSVLGGADLPVLALGGLGRDAVAALLERRSGRAVAASLADRAQASTGGNPLALLELAGADLEELAATPLVGPLPIPARVTDAFLRRAGALPAATRRALVLAAASDRAGVAVIGRAAAALGLGLDDLVPAEDAGVVALGQGRVEFRHPLYRSGVYASASADERRAAHRALADALPDLDADRRAWHLAAGCVGPDETAAAALAQAGARARERSAYVAASAAFERAARLEPDDGRRASLLHAAADAAWLGGRAEESVALLEEAREHADAALGVAVDHLRGHIAVRRGAPEAGRAILAGAAERAAATEPERAALMLAEATNAAFYAGDAAAMLHTAERARSLAGADAEGEVAFFATLAHGMARIFAGEGEAGVHDVRRAVGLLRDGALEPQPRLLAWAVMGPLWLREAGVGTDVAEEAVESARRRSAVGTLPFLLMHVGRDAAGGDRWSRASAAYHEGIALARDTGQRTDLAVLLAALASLEARQGHEPACRDHAAEARALGEGSGPGLHDIWALAALGDLELGLGRPAAAAAQFEELRSLLDRLGVRDADVAPAPELVDAYLRLGRLDEARAEAAAFEELARAKGLPWALARAGFCAGLLADARDLDRRFGEALELHERTPDVFATARTRLAYGSRLRRARRRIDARAQLRDALDAFERLGAAPWAAIAASELAASGENARRRGAERRDELTPQELQVGLLLADGRTTREAAATLFLSPKTVEYHLRHLYAKLGINSRAELAARLQERGRAPFPDA